MSELAIGEVLGTPSGVGRVRAGIGLCAAGLIRVITDGNLPEFRATYGEARAVGSSILSASIGAYIRALEYAPPTGCHIGPNGESCSMMAANALLINRDLGVFRIMKNFGLIAMMHNSVSEPQVICGPLTDGCVPRACGLGGLVKSAIGVSNKF